MNKSKISSRRTRELTPSRHRAKKRAGGNGAYPGRQRILVSGDGNINGTQIFVDEQRYRSLFDLVQVAVYACDTNGVIQEFNGHAVKLWGRKPRLNDPNERFCGSYRMFYPDGRFMPHTQCPMARVLRGEKLRPGDLEIIVERADGERRQILAAPQVVRNERGEITGAINCFYDITDRKRTEYILTETARRQKILYEFVQQRSAAKSLVEIYSVGLDATINLLRCDRAAILLFDSDGVMRFKDRRGLSDRYCRAIEGHSPWISNTRKPEPICIADVDHADIPRKLKATIKAEGIRALAFVPLVAEKKLIGKLTFCFDAPRVLTDEELGLILNAAGQLALGIERKRVEEAFHESEERIRAIVEQTTVGMARAGRDGRILFTNKHFCKMLGYKDGELIGKSIRAFTHKDEAAKTSVLMARLIKHGKAYELEKRYVRKDGSVIWVNVSASPVRDARGRPHSVVAVVVDITARKKAEAALENSKTQLEKLVQQRTQALREANHELENEIQQREGLEGEILSISDREQQRLGQELHDGLCQQLAAIGMMTRAIALRLKDHRVFHVEDLENIARLINDSVITARSIARDLHKEEVDSAGFTQSLYSLVERKIWTTNCQIELKTDINITDDEVAAQLYRILREAIINANKHAKATQIVLQVIRANKELVFSVTDNGVGFASKTRRGRGLGFHIMQHRARSIGARLNWESPRSGGARVVCRLPLF